MTERHVNQLKRIRLMLRRLAVAEEGQGDLNAAEMLMYASRNVANILNIADVQQRDANAVPVTVRGQ